MLYNKGNLLAITKLGGPQVRQLWEWINLMFNKRDDERYKKFGPDRTCAEWVLRNGGSVKFAGYDKYLSDYNSLPDENVHLQLIEIDATNCSIAHHGFNHLENCSAIKRIKFHRCNYLRDEALALLKPIDESLKYLEITSCHDISSVGLHSIDLTKLKDLVLGDLPLVRNLDEIATELKTKLKCNVEFK